MIQSPQTDQVIAQMVTAIEGFLDYCEDNEDDPDMLYYIWQRMQDGYAALGKLDGRTAAQVRQDRRRVPMPPCPKD